LFTAKAIVAVVLVVGLDGLLVIFAVGAPEAPPERAWARATVRVPAIRRQSPKAVAAKGRRRARGD